MQLIAKTYWTGAPFNFRGKVEATPEPVLLRAADFRQHGAVYWAPPGRDHPKVAVVCLHPRVDFTRHYSFPRLLAAGVACLGANTRHVNNDTDLVHEDILLDVGSAIRYLREKRGIDQVLLLGNSGGGSLAAFYLAQAALPRSERLDASPDGAPTRLRDVELPAADALMLVAAHRGQGLVLSECIDPSVAEESDPLSVTPELDMYAPDNGFREPPTWSEYDAAFVQRFRAAQAARVARLDERARELIADARRAGKHEPGSESERRALLRRSLTEHVMVVYRTMANLNYVDRRLDPSSREYGSLLSERPDLMNYRYLGFARTCTPRAWLSTWSGPSSQANLEKNLPQLKLPTLIVHAERDKEIYPRTDQQRIDDACTAADKTCVVIEGARHYFEPDFGEKKAPDVERLMDVVVPWIQQRFET